jgi:hypothetical protein
VGVAGSNPATPTSFPKHSNRYPERLDFLVGYVIVAGMGPNRRAQERERAAARAAEEAKRAEAERKAAAEAQKIVEIWNARQAGGRALWFYPTIGAAIAGRPSLADVLLCPACLVVGRVDLRTLDRHRGAAISSLIPSLSCRRCSPNAPFAKLEMLSAKRPEW